MNGRVSGCLLIVALALGCRSSAPDPRMADDTSPARIKMASFVDYFSNRVERAADDIAQQESDPAIDRATVYWKLRAIPLAQNALLRQDDQAAVTQLWVISAAMTEAFSGEFGDQLGDGRPIALGAAKDIEKEVRELASTMLTPEQFKKMEPLVADYVKTHVDSTGLSHSAEDAHTWGKTMSSILKKPLHVIQAPFSSIDLTSGLSDTAIAMHRFTDEFARTRVELEYLPRKVRWNTQLLLMELDETADLSAVAKGVAELGASATSLAETAKTLPAELRTELTTFADSLEKNQPGLQATLKEANTTLENTHQTAEALNTMSATMTETFHAFSEIVKSFESDPDAPPAPPVDPADEGPPFDINDYGRTAEKLTETAHALTALFDEFEKVSSATEPPPLLVETEASLRALVDRLLLGGGVLVLFTAAVAYGYRVAVGRRTSA